MIAPPHPLESLATQHMASSWADEMQGDEAGMPALNFTAMLDDAQAAGHNGLSSGDKDAAATPGQRQVGSKARASYRAGDRPER